MFSTVTLLWCNFRSQWNSAMWSNQFRLHAHPATAWTSLRLEMVSGQTTIFLLHRFCNTLNWKRSHCWNVCGVSPFWSLDGVLFVLKVKSNALRAGETAVDHWLHQAILYLVWPASVHAKDVKLEPLRCLLVFQRIKTGWQRLQASNAKIKWNIGANSWEDWFIFLVILQI